MSFSVAFNTEARHGTAPSRCATCSAGASLAVSLGAVVEYDDAEISAAEMRVISYPRVRRYRETARERYGLPIVCHSGGTVVLRSRGMVFLGMDNFLNGIFMQIKLSVM